VGASLANPQHLVALTYLLLSWVGNEGTRTIANVNTSLSGGGTRSSLNQT
jgi:hypothetical protein